MEEGRSGGGGGEGGWGGGGGVVFFFKQKTAYEIGTGDWSSDVCSSDLTTQSQGIIRHEDRSLVIYNKADNRVVASSTAQGEISSQMTPQEKATFDRAWQQTTQQQQTIQQQSRSVDLER